MDLYLYIFAIVAVAFLAGLYGERWRARRARRAWQTRRGGGEAGSKVTPFKRPTETQAPDAADQLRIVMGASFATRPLLSKEEARLLYIAEREIGELKRGWRVMAQVSLGEVLSSPDPKAYGAINSKRADLLIVSRRGDPLAAIEHQGGGHYQGTAPARDAVKKEALRKAGVRYIEMTTDHGEADLVREIARLAELVDRTS
ncbi:DUF2726 domain-containing protein [Phenylobacterium sp.]|uniref:DUF2726 domain-containing protein n=1 Tax=Phenylobacterium sp. TaxID=1871053 RepID=UPI002ED9DC15